MGRPGYLISLVLVVVACAPSPATAQRTETTAPAAVAPAAPVTSPTRAPALTPRQTVDRPDDIDGYQVHFMYVLPKDARDEELDTNGWIATRIASVQRWLERETGGRRLAVDTFRGELDVTFVRLGRDDATLAAYDRVDRQAGIREPLLRTSLEAEIRGLGFDDRRKIYGLFYGGNSGSECAGGSWPPSRVGNVAINLVTADLRPGMRDCSSLRGAFPDGVPYTVTIFHEIFHDLGAVARCAPHHDSQSGGHVTDDPDDIMSAKGSRTAAHVDKGRDDYFGHGNANCVDLARSAFFVPTLPNAEPPPLWPLVTAERRDCAEERALGSAERGKDTGFVFDNLSDSPMQLFELGPQGRIQRTALRPWIAWNERTFTKRAWLVADAAGACLAIFVAQEAWSRAMVRGR